MIITHNVLAFNVSGLLRRLATFLRKIIQLAKTKSINVSFYEVKKCVAFCKEAMTDKVLITNDKSVK